MLGNTAVCSTMVLLIFLSFGSSVQFAHAAVTPSPVSRVIDTATLALNAPRSVNIVTIGSSTFAVVASSSDNGIEIIQLVENTVSETTDIRRGGGSECDGDCVHPTIGLDTNQRKIVDDGFTYNGQTVDAISFHTPFPLITAEVGKINTVTVKAWDNLSVKMIQFGLGVPEIASPINDAEVIIEVWLEPYTVNITEIKITDPHNLIEDSKVSTNGTMVNCSDNNNEQCVSITLSHMYRESPIYNIMRVDVMDISRHLQSTTFNDGVQVVGDSLNPADTLSIGGVTPANYPQRTGLIELVNTDRAEKLWVDKYGYTWHGDDSKMTLLSEIPFERHQDEMSEFSGYNDRYNSHFTQDLLRN